jgi:signal transduction histidine kinase
VLRAIHSIRLKMMFLMVATTFAALLFTAVALVVYDLSTYKQMWVGDLITQANLVGRASAPALAFDDPAAAQNNLDLLSVRPKILRAAIYTRQGALVARYTRDSDENVGFPAQPGPDGYRIDKDRVWIVQGITDATGRLGTIYLEATYDLVRRLMSYLAIIGAVMAASLLVAAFISYRLQAAVTAPLLALTDASHRVTARRDYSQRVTKTTQDEIGDLVDTFNDMLSEVGQRTADLEESNRSLQHEMTIRHVAERALVAADQRKDEFLATLAHELRNPLAPIRNALEIMNRCPDDPSMQREAREIMDRQLRQLVRLVDDLLDVSRITTGKLRLQREVVDFRSIVESALDVARPQIEARGIRFSATLPPRAIPISADATRISQALLNLLTNAAKFSQPGGRVALMAEVSDGMLVTTVEDTGIGIPREKLPDIFEMFTQLDRTLERPYSGLGVGLPLAKRFIELHGGTLEAYSEGDGCGSRFVMRLPIASDPVPAEAPV